MPTQRQINKQGREAEKQVSKVLHSLGVGYYVFDNVILKTKNGTTQIDHVVISPFGIFVIETKSHKGLIFGDDYSKNWTQYLYNGAKYQFYSPYRQNYGHLKSLYKLFGLSCEFFLGIICFTDSSVNLSHCTCSRVTHLDNLYSIIASHTNILFTPYQVDVLCHKLEKSNKQSKYMERKHIKYVKSQQKGN